MSTCAGWALTQCVPPQTADESGAGPTGLKFLAEGDSAGYARAVSPRAFEFPRDHGPHPSFRTEWWYLTGNLLAADGRHFGFELTVFRYALTARDLERASNWGTRHIWMAHLALTDTANERFFNEERIARGAVGLAGAESDGFAVWVRDWSIRQFESGSPMRLRAATTDFSLELDLEPIKAAVAHGDEGLDRKGPEPGNASYYYSLPRLAATGEVGLAGQRSIGVSGLAWMDREWGTSALSPGVTGWDWFALQLSDGRDLMFYRLRRSDGSTSEFSTGTLIDRDGSARALRPDDVTLEAAGHWTSPRSGVRYPVSWRVLIPGEQLRLRIVPVLESQEIDLTVRYWEGAVTVEGAGPRRPLLGRGYLELAGYERETG